jgi:CO dehydrogenase nickel-insertion accessory protein CooC1
MLAIGTNMKTNAIATTSPSDLKAHTMVLGQSGSGKSFFLARLLEELLLRTKARVVAIDPNGDFETFFAPREEAFWTHGDFSDRLRKIKDMQTRQGHNSFDDKIAFVDGWSRLKFQHVIAGLLDISTCETDLAG